MIINQLIDDISSPSIYSRESSPSPWNKKQQAENLVVQEEVKEKKPDFSNFKFEDLEGIDEEELLLKKSTTTKAVSIKETIEKNSIQKCKEVHSILLDYKTQTNLILIN